MTKKIIAIVIAITFLLSGCGTVSKNDAKVHETISSSSVSEDIGDIADNDSSEETNELEPEENGKDSDLSDPKLLQSVEDSVYSSIEDTLDSESYNIENVSAQYVSKDYLEEVEYNSQPNIFFGYTLEELDKQFDGKPYVFTLGDDGTTDVVSFEGYDDTYDKVIKNVAIGSGVILICITVSVVSGGVGAAPISMIFAASAKTGATMAASSGAIGGIFAGAVTGIETHDFDQAKKAAALAASEGFKWGAITGALAGGVSQASALRGANNVDKVAGANSANNVAQEARQAELRALNKYGGDEQISFLDGQKVSRGTPGATRPDIVRKVGDNYEAIEVKHYNLENDSNVRSLCNELKRQVSERNENLPSGYLQRVVLDVKDRGFSDDVINSAVQKVQYALKDIYPDIPIDVAR